MLFKFLNFIKLLSRHQNYFRLVFLKYSLLLKNKHLFKFPFSILKKFFNFLKIEFYEQINSTKNRYESLLKTYKLCNLNKNRSYYIEILNKILKEIGYPIYNESEGMYSEHLIIFAAISKSNLKIKNILEIGTFDGKTATILARMFPDSEITTIDLADKDPLFINSYHRKNNVKEFIKKRNTLISKYKKINFLQLNSLELSLRNKDFPKQDLIWVDGAHGYPIVGCDITNAVGLMHDETILMCDDIFKRSNKYDPIYVSTAGFETLTAFGDADILNTYFFSKRIEKKFNGKDKHISFSRLN